MSNRVHNFNPGPSTLPLEVLQQAQAELLDYAGTGMSILETSHRSPEYQKVNDSASAGLLELLGISSGYQVVFMGGGASLQFSMIPMNLLAEGQSADYVLTGAWSKKAYKEAGIAGQARVAATTEADGVFTRIPTQGELDLDPGARYVHLTSNNTIFGTQWHELPDTGSVPIVVDMSSDFLCRPVDTSRLGVIYGGAQKSLGPAGVTAVVIREDLLASCRSDIPIILRYGTHAEKQSLYNTPPAFAVYLMDLVLKHIKSIGGAAELARRNQRKADRIYGVVDGNPGFFRAPVEKASRSLMNAVFRLPTPELEASFLAQARERGFVGLKGHRSVGGIRVSMYNHLPEASVEALAHFMEEFASAAG